MNQKAIQLFSEALIPLLGFFLWDWGLYFILLFYILDMFANEFVIHLKSRKTANFQIEQTNKSTWIKNGLISITLILIAILLIHLTMKSIEPGIDFINQMKNFWNYTEFGIKQGYVLLPLLFFVGYQQYKMKFLVSAKFRSTVMKHLWKNHLQAFVVVIGFCGLILGLSQFFIFSEIVYVLGTVLVTTLYKWRFSEI
tara:strand:- start:9501 stop:10091 length:591 start_codon:yes stop_codon:yes gene_type:complete